LFFLFFGTICDKEGGAKYNCRLNTTFLGVKNVTFKSEKVKVPRQKRENISRLDGAVVATCQSQGSPALKHILL